MAAVPPPSTPAAPAAATAATASAADDRALLDDAIRFLGHDAREGHSSTLALLELHRLAPGRLPADELVRRLESVARRALDTIDDFAALAQARRRPLQRRGCDAGTLLGDAADAVWREADAAGVKVRVAAAAGELEVEADRDLFAIAFVRLLRDALSGAPAATEVHCAAWCQGAEAGVEVVDAVPEVLRAAGDAPRPGVLLAGVVAARHGGMVELDIVQGRRRVRVRWPAAATPR